MNYAFIYVYEKKKEIFQCCNIEKLCKLCAYLFLNVPCFFALRIHIALCKMYETLCKVK